MKSKENYSGIKGVFKFIANVISWTSLVILILLALFLAYYTISTKLYAAKGEKFEPFISLYTIVSGSMEPNINIYDVVVSKKVNSPDEIKVGDVITFVSTSSISKGMTVTHRVVEIVKTENGVAYKTKGDNNLSPDSAPAEYNNLIGKVIIHIPQLGRAQEFLAKKGGWLIVIVIPALFIIISDILKIFKLAGVKKEIEKIDEHDKKLKIEKKQKEELRKQIIKKRLNLEKNSYEPEPIVTKKNTRIVVAGVPPKRSTKTNAKVTTKSSTRNTKTRTGTKRGRKSTK